MAPMVVWGLRVEERVSGRAGGETSLEGGRIWHFDMHGCSQTGERSAVVWVLEDRRLPEDEVALATGFAQESCLVRYSGRDCRVQGAASGDRGFISEGREEALHPVGGRLHAAVDAREAVALGVVDEIVNPELRDAVKEGPESHALII